ncbi:peptide deformylase [Candidatus Kuenenbacteria bacterium HGW-Kuenenbacteria-1]|uniref:Peptide deformylase n=1 Tax=Candidatus Kuenenbacteria bacterium HGW-Kuenenbacteria-1 TaxID=2013812 RepID=A0A2N1UP43_9BACT|nr:MAG: peptide deformylase [Candidatus Kuenenbacteria bacterium HGW-Kuenenbacteria-1]
MSLEIIKYPNPILRLKSKKIKKKDILKKKTQELIKQMVETLEKVKGAGLAAPQIGKSIKLILVRNYDEINDNAFCNTYYNKNCKILILINPKIINKSWKKEIEKEGCLSIYKNSNLIFGLVKRSKKITIKTLDKNGEKISFKAENLLARIIQHEVDHLNGILFIDKTI